MADSSHVGAQSRWWSVRVAPGGTGQEQVARTRLKTGQREVNNTFGEDLASLSKQGAFLKQ